MTRAKPFFFATLLFLSGAVFGAACFHFAIRYHVIHRFEHHQRMIVPAVMKRLTKELALTAMQQTQVRPIIETMHERLVQVRKETAPRIEGILDDSAAQVEPLLMGPQKAKLQALRERVKQHFERRDRGDD